MKRRLIGIAVGLSLGTMLMGTIAASASPGTGVVGIKAIVVTQACTLNGGMYVTLSVAKTAVVFPRAFTAPGTLKPNLYTWDLTNNGVYETALSLSPMTKQFYATSATGHMTATVKAVRGSGTTLSSVRFSTVCP